MKTIAEIKAEFAAADMSSYPALYEIYKEDTRSGVQKLIAQCRKKEAALEAEKQRIENMKVYEHKYEHLGYLCGIDEVGRGPLAGPVVACAVILPQDSRILYLNDSKKLSASKREELYDVIMREAVSVGIGMRSPERIDEINILQATYEAMREAVSKLEVVPQLLLNDAVTIPQITIPQVPIIKGDAKSVSIAAASIVAKVTRDRMMEEYDKVFPEYGFASNKGYGSADHIAALNNDAVTIPQITIPQVPIIKGDAKSVSIAAASIVAKVTRDRMMEEYDKVFPEYGFASNKGYGSADHIAALKKYGETPIHRKTFITHFI